MTDIERTPIHRENDKELLGFVVRDKMGWQAQTIFGYEISRAKDLDEAESVVRKTGLSFLTGVWQYYDEDENTWLPCVLKEVRENQVTIIRTSVFGYQDPDDYKRVIINNPSETNLVKSQ